jgi:DNA-binding GntR family transcriptional regulator
MWDKGVPSRRTQVTAGVDRPSYQPIFEDLAEQIRSGKLATGSPLPSIATLMERYDATVGIVRRALIELRAEGLIRSQQGVGSFVQPVPAEQPSEGYRELTRMMGQMQDRVEALAERVARLEHGQGPRSAGPGHRAERTGP